MGIKDLFTMFFVLALSLGGGYGSALLVWYGGLHVFGDGGWSRAIIGPLSVLACLVGVVAAPGLVGMAVEWVQRKRGE